MALKLGQRRVEQASVVDDDKLARETLGYSIEDLDLEPVPLERSSDMQQIDLQACMDFVRGKSQAVICDYHLRKQSYANFNGAQFVAQCYQAKFPAILCTRFEQSDILDLRSFRRYIPSLLTPDNVDPDSLRAGWEQCDREFQGKLEPDRRPWRALARIVEIDKSRKECRFFLPGWNPHEALTLKFSDFGTAQTHLLSQAEEIDTRPIRLYVQTNLGAETAADLYFYDWETD